MTSPGPADWDAGWRRLLAACVEARRRLAAGEADTPSPAEYPPIAPPPTPSPERPVLRDDVARLAALSRAYLLGYSSAGEAVSVGLLVTSRGPGDLAFSANVLPGAGARPEASIGPVILLEASRALLTSPIVRAGRFWPRAGGRLPFEPEPGFAAPPAAADGEPVDLPGLVLRAFEVAGLRPPTPP